MRKRQVRGQDQAENLWNLHLSVVCSSRSLFIQSIFPIFQYVFLPFSCTPFCIFFFMTCQVGLRHGKFGYGIEVSKATALAIYGCGTLARG